MHRIQLFYTFLERMKEQQLTSNILNWGDWTALQVVPHLRHRLHQALVIDLAKIFD